MISWSPHFPRMRNREGSKDGERKNILLTLSSFPNEIKQM